MIKVVPFIYEDLDDLYANTYILIDDNNGCVVIDPATDSNTGKYVYGNLDYSLVFDPVFYANKYSDLKKAFGTNASLLFSHFINNGMSEARQANATFNVKVYEANYKDLQQAFGVPNGVDPKWIPYYQHYIMFGYNEKRKAI